MPRPPPSSRALPSAPARGSADGRQHLHSRCRPSRRGGGGQGHSAGPSRTPALRAQSIVAERDVVLPLLPFGLREERTRNVSINISVAEGSHLDPLALELEEGVELFSRPDVDAQNGGGGWVAEFLCNWRRPGRYRPRVRVSNPLGSETVSLRTSILVQSIPQAVVLMRPVAEVGQEVVFHALSNGTDVRYDWTLPRGEVLRDAAASSFLPLKPITPITPPFLVTLPSPPPP
ncbi:hypothetical protein C7M84_005284 [Penaeus vannamei]|uniref:Uncharacterized protein n=1 Tax=Penaeus vannamei TaxID=6689 RepID=A0A423TI60_PENVA|nr:hypothetical protein C7M84_005284 [Penaeus vannamei]